MLINKNLSLLGIAFGILSLCSLKGAVLTGVDPTIIDIGSGPDLSYLVIDESTLSPTPLEFVYHYTYDSNAPLTGYDLLGAITNVPMSGLGISATFNTNYLAHTLDGISYKATNVDGTPFSTNNETGVYWSLYEAGGMEAGGADSLPSNSWTFAGVGLDGRIITPNSWDGWTLSSYTDGGLITVDVPPSVTITAVPEPEAAPLLLLSILTLIILLFRWKSSAPNSIP